jgi:tryptophanyl-tRNA synthetase
LHTLKDYIKNTLKRYYFMSIVFSGIQPTGMLHIGNYLGALKPWKEMITEDKSFFFSIVDMHAITVFNDPAILQESIIRTFAGLLACGLDPRENKNIKIFQQSRVSAHAELSWIISCNTPLGWLDRMTQYKEKTKEHKERECLGLYAYPCLMAADILLYNTDIVPVGEDQKQHLELTRDIAIRLNSLYKKEVFKIPAPSISSAKRVMSLNEGNNKMSKSNKSEASRINLEDSSEIILNKVMKAKTGNIDSIEVKNLLTIYKEMSGKDYIAEGEIQFSQFKKELAEIIIEALAPISLKMKNLLKNPIELSQMLKEYSSEVEKIACKNLQLIKREIGFIN